MLLLNPRHRLLHLLIRLVHQLIDILSRDRLARIQPRPVVHPLPELDPGDLGGRGVFHEPVEGDAAVAAEPGAGVGEGGGDVAADAFGGDLSWDFGVKKVGGGDADVFAADVVLWTKKNQNKG